MTSIVVRRLSPGDLLITRKTIYGYIDYDEKDRFEHGRLEEGSIILVLEMRVKPRFYTRNVWMYRRCISRGMIFFIYELELEHLDLGYVSRIDV